MCSQGSHDSFQLVYLRDKSSLRDNREELLCGEGSSSVQDTPSMSLNLSTMYKYQRHTASDSHWLQHKNGRLGTAWCHYYRRRDNKTWQGMAHSD